MPEDKTPNTVRDDIADTLFIPLIMKCRETRRKNAFFSDPAACDMAERIDYDFSKYGKAPRSSVGVACRSKYFDGIAARFIKNHRNPVVINIGCGLDARYQRLGRKLAKKAVFYELDIPEVMEMREKLLPESHNDRFIRASMFETEWLDALRGGRPDASFLFIAEGVLMYFEKERVKGFFSNISERFSQGDIIFDVTSSWMCKNTHRHETVKLTNAPFKFALDDDKEIEGWGDGLKLMSVKYYGDFEEWRRCGLFTYWVMKLVPTIKNASRLLHYRFG